MRLTSSPATPGAKLRQLPLLALAALLGGCEGVQSVLDPAGRGAAAVADLWWYFFAVASAVTLTVGALLLYGPLRAREVPPAERERSDQRKARVVAGGVAATVVILVVTFVLSLLTGRVTEAEQRLTGEGAAVEMAGAPVSVEVIGYRFWWAVRYYDAQGELIASTANEVHLPAGQTVPVRVRTADVIHSFWVPNLHGKIDMIPGRVNQIRIHAEEPGVYRGQCAEFCGMQHAKMAFMAVVEPPERFAAYLRRLARPAAPPDGPLERAGLEVFLQTGCADCHAIRGTPADSELGPELTHLASRLTLGAGILPNTRGHLGGWITNPQQIKPGNNMPAVPLTAEQLRALLAYLETLQ